ncbi:MAG: HlyD family type I secretion periplasmic adaptor subunit [Hyphomicrobiales bacterium]|nr:MAG: HlyD family type I secretion periplasmic adaptor subunit [Hyphomicrobiales bacterium]
MRDKRPPRIASSVILLIAALMLALVFWASLTEIDEITRGEGKIIPAGRSQIVQATEPGVVKKINVKVGQFINRNQLIVQLDDTTTTSSLGESKAKVRALKAQIARLSLEQSGNLDQPYNCPEDLKKVAPRICDNEAELLAARKSKFTNTLSVLRQRQLQREKELNEALANMDRLEGNLAISHRELKIIAPMAKQKLVAKTELIRVQRTINDNSGQLQTVRESIARIKSAINEAKLQVQELRLQLQQEALAEKTNALAELSVLEETIRGASDRVARTDIKSPVDGVINRIEVNTLGAFVQPGTVIAEIVPTSEELLVEARINPKDVAFIRAGQPALVKITAYDFSIYGGLEGKVITVTPDSIVDQKTGEAYFEVRVKTSKSYLKKNNDLFEITPGMMCTVEIQTGRKTILHYLFKPINKTLNEALTER